MYVLITYDVATSSPDGEKRLRKVAKACENKGQRVQNSVFECEITPAQFIILKNQLSKIINPQLDSLRFYMMGNNWQKKIEHLGAKSTYDISGPLII